MSSNIETNAPAFLQIGAGQALDALNRGDLDLAREILLEIEKVSSQLVEWFERLAKSGHNLPANMTWTKFIHQEQKKEV